MTAAAREPITTPGGVWWNINTGRWGKVASDELTLDEVERIETITDVAWAIGNPLASLRQAKAWLMVAAMHAGATEAEATALVTPGQPGALNLGGIKGAFQLHGGSAPLSLVDDEVPPVPPT
jgi:hypothetical protein